MEVRTARERLTEIVFIVINLRIQSIFQNRSDDQSEVLMHNKPETQNPGTPNKSTFTHRPIIPSFVPCWR
jgi:hypothetical protein